MGPAELREKWARSWAKTSGSHQVPLRKAVLHRLCQLCIGVLWGRDGVPCRERGERARPWAAEGWVAEKSWHSKVLQKGYQDRLVSLNPFLLFFRNHSPDER